MFWGASRRLLTRQADFFSRGVSNRSVLPVGQAGRVLYKVFGHTVLELSPEYLRCVVLIFIVVLEMSRCFG